ncbi:MAG: hypothetical protein F9K26_08520 [Ignavibacteriaceae bacterium]|jgi:hypothetical protein|nr:MAG: hypothetical protein F9K26_08520 [Ignavibacteriaceae bacterium]
MGQIWSVRTDLGKDANIGVDVLPLVSSPYIFLLTNPVSLSDTSGETGLRLHKEDRFVEFLPVSLSTEYSDRHDFIVPANNDILGVEFMVETQLLGSCLVSDLAECFGELPEEEEEKVLNLHFFTHGMEYDEELLAKTKTGRENEEKNFFIRDFKEIEFRNLRMIEEPVRALENIIEFSEVVTIPREGYALAAADRNTNIGGLVPKTTRILFENDNLSVKINSYENLGYYFNINIASELLATKSSADKSTATESLTSKPPVSESLPSEQLPPEPHSGKFSFISEKIDDSSVKLEHKDLTPDEYFFPFYSEFTDGFYRLSIVADGKTLWHDEFKILTEKE